MKRRVIAIVESGRSVEELYGGAWTAEGSD
jgi:hypothetical protein